VKFLVNDISWCGKHYVIADGPSYPEEIDLETESRKTELISVRKMGDWV
jgi:hypothetical protein